MKIATKITTKILESPKDISKQIIEACSNHLNKRIKKCLNTIKINTRIHLLIALTKQPEYKEIISGRLGKELGITSPAEKMNSIFNEIISSVEVTTSDIRIKGSSFTGGLKLEAVQKGYSNLLSLKDASFITNKGVSLNWLQWLLLEGNNIIVADYHFQKLSNKGRTKGGIMVKKGSWAIPSQFAGTASDNFITRAIRDIQPQIKKEIIKCLTSV